MKIEPAKRQGLAQRRRIGFLEGDFEDFLPTAETSHLRIDDFPAQTNGFVAFLVWEPGKLLPIFIAARVMG